MKLKMKVQRGDGSSYDSIVDVDDEVGREMLKRDGVELADKPEKKAEAAKAEPAAKVASKKG